MTPARWYRALAGAASATLALLLLIAAPAALAQSNRIKAVDVSTVGEQTVLTVELERPLAQTPVDFTTQNPARLAIDFADTGIANGRAQYDYGGKVVKAANVVQIGSRTRMILELTRNATYRTDLRGNVFVVALDNVAPAVKNAAPTFAPAATMIPALNGR